MLKDYQTHCQNCNTELPLEVETFEADEFCYYCDEYEAPHSHWFRGSCLECLKRHEEDLELAKQQDIAAGTYKESPGRVEIPFELFKKAYKEWDDN